MNDKQQDVTPQATSRLKMRAIKTAGSAPQVVIELERMVVSIETARKICEALAEEKDG